MSLNAMNPSNPLKTPMHSVKAITAEAQAQI